MRAAAPLLLVGLAAIGMGPASAQDPTPAQRLQIRQIIVYGTDPCPPSPEGVIVICARRPENERYRIPEELRETPKSPESVSWAARAEQLEFVGRTGIQSCSTVGPGGFTGCFQQMLREAQEERRAAAKEGDKVP